MLVMNKETSHVGDEQRPVMLMRNMLVMNKETSHVDEE